MKDKYITTDFATQSKFKSSFTWTLYDFLKANYGYWHKIIAKDSFMRLFCVENVKSYQKNTGDFKKLVLNTANEEINKYTELEVWYKEIKKGRSIVAFDIYWTNGNQKSSATEKQIVEIQSILDVVFDDVFRYVNLKNDDDREHAIELIRELEGNREYIVEPICITKEFAHTLLIKANSILKDIEYLKEQNNKPEGHRIYNWLEEKE